MPRLVIDYGAVGTVAVLVWPDGRLHHLQFDGEPVLPSAVHTAPSGETVTGQQAWQRASSTPGVFTASPLHTRTTADPDLVRAAQTAAAATLRRVADDAARVAGQPVDEVRLVVPARWGPRRRTWLRGAVSQAGLGEPWLIDAPGAVAGLLPLMAVPVPDRAVLLIVDVGSGCEATVLRREPDGYRVLSLGDDPQAGGDAIDDSLLDHVEQTSTAGDQPAPGRTPLATTTHPAATDGRRWALLASVRAGKHSLTHRATASVGLPPPAPAAIISAATVRHLAHPVVHRAAGLALRTVTTADVSTDELYGIYLVGAAAATPGLTEAITEQFGIVPAVVPDPATAAALGAAAAIPDTPASKPVPAGSTAVLARIAAVAVPALASIGLLSQFLITSRTDQPNTAASAGVVSWGELTLAALYAVLACLYLAPNLPAVIRQVIPAPASPAPGTAAPYTLLHSVIAAAAIGVGLTGLYAVTVAVTTGHPLATSLRWAVVPALCLAAAAVTVTVVVSRRQPPPAEMINELTIPGAAIILVTAGMLLIQYTLTTPRPPDLAGYLDIGTRLGGLLLGAGAAFTLVPTLVLRLALALPLSLLTATVVSAATTGVLAIIVTITMLSWCCYPLFGARRAENPAGDPSHEQR